MYTERTTRNVSISKGLYNESQEYAKSTGRTFSGLVIIALQEFMKNHGRKNS